MYFYRMTVDGMSCGHCVARVKTALENAGFSVQSCSVGSSEVGTDMTLDAARISAETALAEIGFSLSSMERANA